KFHFPLLITSGARTIYDLRTPQDIMALYRCLGLNKEEILMAISVSPSFILDYNQQRKDMVVDGVKIIDEK
ncbi:MAG: ribonuclease P, partial [Methanobacterium sp.]|nr:ribonuclease P [Methanobacterium sp.]